MSEEYKEYCMKFSNEEIKEYMIEYLIRNSWNNDLIRVLSEDGEEIEISSSERIGAIVFDGKNENLFINFYGIHTSIFAHNNEIMFIDEGSKGIYTESDVYNNAVYEGELRKMSHEEMLRMFSEIVLCFHDAIYVSMTKLDVPEGRYKKYNYYQPHEFMMCVQNDHIVKEISVYENITIKH